MNLIKRLIGIDSTQEDCLTRNNENELAMNTIIGKGTHVEGSIEVEQNLRIDGSFTGQLKASDTLIVGATGELMDVSVEVKDATIANKVKGNVTASSKVTLESSSRFDGELTTKILVVEGGAYFTGKCRSGDNAFRNSSHGLDPKVD